MGGDTADRRPIVAICYDFDKTLSPTDMQAQGYIQSLGLDVDAFWRRSGALAKASNMDQNLAYMYTMLEEARGRLTVSLQALHAYGARVKLYPGVREWFGRTRRAAEERGLRLEHYIISSGLKEMIEGTTIAGEFKQIYASAFYFDERSEARWPAQAVNFTNKTQFLFRIEKGVLDINDPAVNAAVPSEQMRIPFRDMIYIGDSDTDIPCMKLVSSRGGYAIGVYDPVEDNRTKVHNIMLDGRIDYFAPADYAANAPLDALINKIFDHIAATEALRAVSLSQHAEAMNARAKAVERSIDD